MPGREPMKVRIQLKDGKAPILLNGVTVITGYPIYIYFRQPREIVTLKEKIRRDEIVSMIVEMSDE